MTMIACNSVLNFYCRTCEFHIPYMKSKYIAYMFLHDSDAMKGFLIVHKKQHALIAEEDSKTRTDPM